MFIRSFLKKKKLQEKDKMEKVDVKFYFKSAIFIFKYREKIGR